MSYRPTLPLPPVSNDGKSGLGLALALCVGLALLATVLFILSHPIRSILTH